MNKPQLDSYSSDMSAERLDVRRTAPVANARELALAEMQGQKVTLSDEQLVKAIERAIKAIQGPNTSLEFSVHKATKEVVVRVLEKETGKVIREIPPEKQLDFVAKLMEMAGLLVDQRI